MGVLSVLFSMSLKYKLIMLILFGVFVTVSYYILKTLKTSKPDPVQETSIVYQPKPDIFIEKTPHKIESKPKKKIIPKKSQKQKELDEKIRRAQIANNPGYKIEDSPFQMFLHHGVITYRKKRNRKKGDELDE